MIQPLLAVYSPMITSKYSLPELFEVVPNTGFQVPLLAFVAQIRLLRPNSKPLVKPDGFHVVGGSSAVTAKNMPRLAAGPLLITVWLVCTLETDRSYNPA